MKKFTLFAFALLAISITSCKKDRVCDCTYTQTSSSGNVTSNPNYNTSYKDIRKSDAKSLCASSTETYIDENSKTTTYMYDCKLK